MKTLTELAAELDTASADVATKLTAMSAAQEALNVASAAYQASLSAAQAIQTQMETQLGAMFPNTSTVRVR